MDLYIDREVLVNKYSFLPELSYDRSCIDETQHDASHFLIIKFGEINHLKASRNVLPKKATMRNPLVRKTIVEGDTPPLMSKMVHDATMSYTLSSSPIEEIMIELMMVMPHSSFRHVMKRNRGGRTTIGSRPHANDLGMKVEQVGHRARQVVRIWRSFRMKQFSSLEVARRSRCNSSIPHDHSKCHVYKKMENGMWFELRKV
jgi:hypothetical protein